jgi:hypothetical protein
MVMSRKQMLALIGNATDYSVAVTWFNTQGYTTNLGLPITEEYLCRLRSCTPVDDWEDTPEYILNQLINQLKELDKRQQVILDYLENQPVNWSH